MPRSIFAPGAGAPSYGTLDASMRDFFGETIAPSSGSFDHPYMVEGRKAP